MSATELKGKSLKNFLDTTSMYYVKDSSGYTPRGGIEEVFDSGMEFKAVWEYSKKCIAEEVKAFNELLPSDKQSDKIDDDDTSISNFTAEYFVDWGTCKDSMLKLYNAKKKAFPATAVRVPVTALVGESKMSLDFISLKGAESNQVKSFRRDGMNLSMAERIATGALRYHRTEKLAIANIAFTSSGVHGWTASGGNMNNIAVILGVEANDVLKADASVRDAMCTLWSNDYRGMSPSLANGVKCDLRSEGVMITTMISGFKRYREKNGLVNKNNNNESVVAWAKSDQGKEAMKASMEFVSSDMVKYADNQGLGPNDRYVTFDPNVAQKVSKLFANMAMSIKGEGLTGGTSKRASKLEERKVKLSDMVKKNVDLMEKLLIDLKI